MCRCVSCNATLNENDLRKTKPDGTPEDLCYSCRTVASKPDFVKWREFALEPLTSNRSGFYRTPQD